ncbi:unnamed protein product [Notodromas monacha]|uniref:Uncharacterized protein n=1 Tax=Notodromas monacha TaxID=399045 RepID=A0A7R9BXN8_9CRUS|nr:unnamed protein product [Notodromas monacha]CAG0922528.1 unnamed protein product [Notodromas monacha]
MESGTLLCKQLRELSILVKALSKSKEPVEAEFLQHSYEVFKLYKYLRSSEAFSVIRCRQADETLAQNHVVETLAFFENSLSTFSNPFEKSGEKTEEVEASGTGSGSMSSTHMSPSMGFAVLS